MIPNAADVVFGIFLLVIEYNIGGDAPKGATNGNAPKGATNDDAPKGATNGDAPKGATNGSHLKALISFYLAAYIMKHI